MIKLPAQPHEIIKDLSREEAQNLVAATELNPLKYFCPNGAQERCINTIAESTEKTKIPVILVTFANGVGKTTISTHIILNIIFGPQNGWFDLPLFRDFPFPHKCWYASTAEALSETIEPMINDIAKPEYIKDREYTTSKEGRRIVSKINFKNSDWEINFKTFDQDPKTYESANVGQILVDEPAPAEVWKAIKSRRRMGCLTILPMTPLYCPPYILDEIYESVTKERTGYYHIKADVYEACKKRGVRGHLDPQIIDDMVENYDDEEKQARAFAEFMYFSGRIYDNLDRNLHFVNPDEYPIPPNSKIMHVVDPHDSRPSASIYAAKTPLGRYIIFDETPQKKDRLFWDMKRSYTLGQEVHNWASIENYYKFEDNTTERVMDRRLGWQTRGQKTFAELYEDEGRKIGRNFIFNSSYQSTNEEGELAFGHKQVRKALGILPDGKPGLVIYNTCYHTWQGLTHYIRRRETGKLADERIQADAKIVEKYKDFPDVVRYMVCHDLTVHVEPKPKPYSQKLKEKAIDDALERTYGNEGSEWS